MGTQRQDKKFNALKERCNVRDAKIIELERINSEQTRDDIQKQIKAIKDEDYADRINFMIG